jgi:ketosteroid isomerase-like protein
MLSWLTKRALTYQLARLSAGDPRPVLWLDAPDVRMKFPGHSSFAADLHGRAEHERWLRRFVALGIQISADEVIVKGFPWNMTLCVRGTDHLRSHQGELVYDNRYVIWGRMAWGRLKHYEVYEDTQATEKLDAWLAANKPALAASAA